jgi:exopolyphosphatase
MQGELGRLYSSYVTGTIDHHDDEGTVPHDCDGEPRIICKSGSCASLVVEYCKEGWDALSSTMTDREQGPHAEEVVDAAEEWDAEAALLALAPILIDTTNLTDAAKATAGDVSAARYLESKIKLGAEVVDVGASRVGAARVGEGRGQGHGHDSDAYFREISEAKEGIEGLGLEDILRKDYKQWTEHVSVVLGISSAVKNIDFLIRKAGSKALFLDKLRRFAEERQLSAVVIMTTSTSEEGEFRRELLVWGIDGRGADVAKRFENDAGDSLELEEWGNGALDEVNGSPEVGWRRCWVQGKVEKSRKQVAPLLRKAVA